MLEILKENTFPNVKEVKKNAKFSACGGLFLNVNLFSNVPKVQFFRACGGPTFRVLRLPRCVLQTSIKLKSLYFCRRRAKIKSFVLAQVRPVDKRKTKTLYFCCRHTNIQSFVLAQMRPVDKQKTKSNILFARRGVKRKHFLVIHLFYFVQFPLIKS